MKLNEDKLAIISVQGSVDHPGLRNGGYRVGYDGYGRITMGTGGITYNYKIGDSCMGIEGDHVEPGVSLANSNGSQNNALIAYACVGNIAKIVSGDAKGKCGFVTGKHGGVDHVMVYFDEETLDQMTTDDKVLIKAQGLGLKLVDHSDIQVMNIDPNLLKLMGIKENGDGIEVPVVTCVPACLMGSGLGEATIMMGDYDIMTQDKDMNAQYGINELRFGDLVAVLDHDNHNGPHYRKDAISIGVVVHSDSFTSGHGPGLTIVLSSKTNNIKPIIDKNANIATYLLK